MHADEVDTDVSLVRRLLASQFPHLADLPIAVVDSWGTDNALYRIGDELLARLPRTPRTAEALAKETAWLPRLAPLLPLTVPIPVAQGDPSAGYPFGWSIYRWIRGEDATKGAAADPGRLAGDLAAFVVALHAIDLAGGPLRAATTSFEVNRSSHGTPRHAPPSSRWARRSTSRPSRPPGTRPSGRRNGQENRCGSTVISTRAISLSRTGG